MAPYLGNSEVLTQDQKKTEHLLSHLSVGLPTKWAVGISQAMTGHDLHGENIS